MDYPDMLGHATETFVSAVMAEDCAQCTKPTRVNVVNPLGVFTTDGDYFISFGISTKRGYRRKAKYAIHCDILPRACNRYFDWDHFCYQAKANERWGPMFEWVLKYTTISPKLFDIALNNPRLKVYFTIDYEKVCADYGPYITAESVSYRYGGVRIKCHH